MTEKEKNKEQSENNQSSSPIDTSVAEGPRMDPLHTLDELKDLLLRTQANFENYRKQAQKRLEEMQEMAARDSILGILPIFDTLDLALKHVDMDRPENFIKGVTLISTQFNTFLEQNGVAVVPTVGGKFDPFLHEAILKTPSEAPENTILEEYQRGFLLHGKVIRHAKVKVSAGRSVEKKE